MDPICVDVTEETAISISAAKGPESVGGVVEPILEEEEDHELELGGSGPVDQNSYNTDPSFGCRRRVRHSSELVDNQSENIHDKEEHDVHDENKGRLETKDDKGGHGGKLPEKRRITEVDDADSVSSTERKRKFQLETQMRAPLTGTSSDDDEDEDTLNMKAESILAGVSSLPSHKDFVDDITTQEIADLRRKLQEGCFQNYFSWTFWQKLHSNYGSILGYLLGFVTIIGLNFEWMLEEFADTNEGHSVAKTFVILFIIYAYSFITMGLELVQLIYLVLELYFPQRWQKIVDYYDRVRNMNDRLQGISSSKYFATPFVGLWCVLTGAVGSLLWNWFWWNHICKSYHDRTCRGSWLGQLVIKYRDDACYDGTASSMICERFVSYAPIMIFSVLFVFIGNVLIPLLNDRLSAYHPMAEKLETALDLIDMLKEEAAAAKPEDTKFEFTPQKKNLNFTELGSEPKTEVIHFGGGSDTPTEPPVKKSVDGSVQTDQNLQ